MWNFDYSLGKGSPATIVPKQFVKPPPKSRGGAKIRN